MDWSGAWPVIKDVLLAFFGLCTTVVTLRYGYLKFIKPYDAQQGAEAAKYDRAEKNTTIRVLGRLLDEERASAASHQERCDKQIQTLGDKLDKLRTEVNEVSAAAELARGLAEESDRQRDKLYSENNRLMIRVARLHAEIVHMKKRIGDNSPTSDPEIDLSHAD